METKKKEMNILRIPKNRLLQYLQVQSISVVNLFLFVWFVKLKFDKVEFCFQILYKPIYIYKTYLLLENGLRDFHAVKANFCYFCSRC